MKLLSVPGWHGSGPDHWQSLWESKYADFERVEQQDWDNPRAADWFTALDRSIGRQEEPVILVAHSLGCLVVTQWLTRVTHTGVVEAALLVAPPLFDEKRPAPPEIVGFTPIVRTSLPVRSTLVASRTDMYIAFSDALALAEQWGADLVDAGDAGHINAESGYGDWREGEQVLLRLLGNGRSGLGSTPASQLQLLPHR